MSSLEPGRYHIKSQLSGLYFTAFPSPGFLVAQPEKGEPFEFRPAGPHFAIYLYGLPIGIGDDKVVLHTETLWRVTKVEGQDAWVFGEADGPKGWWFDPGDEERVVNVRPLLVLPSEPPQYPPPELFVLEKA